MSAKAQIPGPPRKSRLQPLVSLKAEPTPDNLSEPSDEGWQSFIDLNFKVSPKFHRRFRMEAAARGLSMKGLMVAAFQAYLDAHGGTMERLAQELL